jgi:hypothetical protein
MNMHPRTIHMFSSLDMHLYHGIHWSLPIGCIFIIYRFSVMRLYRFSFLGMDPVGDQKARPLILELLVPIGPSALSGVYLEIPPNHLVYRYLL